MPLHDDELFLLSYYRTSEINGSLFFGRLARTVRSGPIQHDLSKHFADEAQHAWYWTRCIDRLGARPIPMASGYQDQYLEAAGLPVNLMEVLAITLVFEQRRDQPVRPPPQAFRTRPGNRRHVRSHHGR